MLAPAPSAGSRSSGTSGHDLTILAVRDQRPAAFLASIARARQKYPLPGALSASAFGTVANVFSVLNVPSRRRPMIDSNLSSAASWNS
jgi:hypothetical protein